MNVQEVSGNIFQYTLLEWNQYLLDGCYENLKYMISSSKIYYIFTAILQLSFCFNREPNDRAIISPQTFPILIHNRTHQELFHSTTDRCYKNRGFCGKLNQINFDFALS